MMDCKPKVLVTSRIPEEGMCMLEEHCEIVSCQVV